MIIYTAKNINEEFLEWELDGCGPPGGEDSIEEEYPCSSYLAPTTFNENLYDNSGKGSGDGVVSGCGYENGNG